MGPGAADDRLGEERRILDLHFPGFVLREVAAPGELAEATGSLSTFTRRAYDLRILLSAQYPHRLPRILPHGWRPESNPHLIGGGLCVMRESQWQSFMSVAFIVAKAALWLNKYEIFLDKRVWPGAEQHFHGPLYRLKKWLHDL